MRLLELLAAAGGGGGWSPLELGGDLDLWLDAADSSSITITSGRVSQWDDKSGNGYHVSQATAGLRPTYSATALNSLPGLVYDSTGRVLANTTNFMGFEYSIFAVADFDYFAGYQRLISASTDVLLLFGGGAVYFTTMFRSGATWGDTNANTPLVDVTSASVLGVVKGNGGAGAAIPYVNGTAQNAKNASTAFTHDITIGSILSGQYFQGSVSEVIITSSLTTTDERQKIEGYLAHKWGLEGSLPGAHPYKSAAP